MGRLALTALAMPSLKKSLVLELAGCEWIDKRESIMMHELMEACDEKRLRALQKQLTNVKLLIIDELGYVPFTAIGAELLFQIFNRPDEHGATLVTANLPFDE